MGYYFETLSDKHDRQRFDCGESTLDKYLKMFALQQIKKNIARTFVLIASNDPARIVGFYTVTLPDLEIVKLPREYSKKLPTYPLPTMKLARLAIDKKFQNKGHGKLLIIEFMRRALEVSRVAPLICLTVDAKNKKLSNYYKKMGFVDLARDNINSLPVDNTANFPLFIMINEVAKFFEK